MLKITKNDKITLYIMLGMFLAVVVLFIGFFIGYNMGIDDNKNNDNQDTTKVNSDDLNVEKYLNSINNNLKYFDESEKVSFDFKIECLEESEGTCLESNIIINNNSYYVSSTAEIYYNENFILIKDEGGSGFSGEFKIIDFFGKELINKKHVGTICNDDGCDYFGIKGDNEKIYYIDNNNNKLYLNYIDLNSNFNIEMVTELEEYNIAG